MHRAVHMPRSMCMTRAMCITGKNYEGPKLSPLADFETWCKEKVKGKVEL